MMFAGTDKILCDGDGCKEEIACENDMRPVWRAGWKTEWITEDIMVWYCPKCAKLSHELFDHIVNGGSVN